MEHTKEETIELIEQSVGNYYLGLYRLRALGLYKEELSSIDTLINMLMVDKHFLLSKYKKELE